MPTRRVRPPWTSTTSSRRSRFTRFPCFSRSPYGYVALYSHQLPQSALKGQTPIQAMELWH
ncbi:hypothetical protein EII20_10545 [Comamonadaceae bacterium OH2545_COT-014]|nr:hypothetical protein EII20_10545 [Comamonadaceae bacterium OH2545_COT-014]